jgi:hypothetical protein
VRFNRAAACGGTAQPRTSVLENNEPLNRSAPAMKARTARGVKLYQPAHPKTVDGETTGIVLVLGLFRTTTEHEHD